MGKIKFKKGYITDESNNNVPDLATALRDEARCNPCGCDGTLGYISTIDVFSGELTVVYVYEGEVRALDTTAVTFEEFRQWLVDMCAWRAAGSVGQPPISPVPE